MNYKFNILSFLIIYCIYSCSNEHVQPNTERSLSIDTFLINKSILIATKQFNHSINHYSDPYKVPRSIDENGIVEFNTYNKGIHWTVGFYPGSLWLLYELTHEDNWLRYARTWTYPLEKIKNYTYTHDLGFMLYCSYGNGYRLTSDIDYKRVLIVAANSLLTRYDKKIEAIKSHDYPGYSYPVIIDNMMNLELLFWATKETGDSIYYLAAKNHALTTLKHHFRSNMSVYQYVDFSIVDGSVVKKGNTQGYSDESEWARGQAWALYGYVMTYRETKDRKFLDAAIKIADYLLENSNMKSTVIPKWDLKMPGIDKEPFDASAGAVICSALFDLYMYVQKSNENYKVRAIEILSRLSSNYFLADPGSNNYFVLKHSVGSYPLNQNVDAPIVYADYYFLESLVKYLNVTK